MAHFWHYFRGLDAATSSKRRVLTLVGPRQSREGHLSLTAPHWTRGPGDSCPSVLMSPCHSHAGHASPHLARPGAELGPAKPRELPGSASAHLLPWFLRSPPPPPLPALPGLWDNGQGESGSAVPGSLQLLLWDSCGTEPGETRGSRSHGKETAAREAKGSSLTSPEGCSVLVRAKPPKINEIKGFIATSWLVPHSLSCCHSLTPQERRRDFYCSALAVNSRSG